MVKEGHYGTYLLIDAAGPKSVIGIIRDDRWLEFDESGEEFMEWFQQAFERLLRKTGLTLNQMDGIYYGSGPGSTLGLRLAAMFIRSLLVTPGLDHWKCFQYMNLELAACSVPAAAGKPVVAPWKRDRLHMVSWDVTTNTFVADSVDSTRAASENLAGFLLGKRLRNHDSGISWHNYPAERIPGILRDHPFLLKATSVPTPYTFKLPEFKKWESGRHTAK